MAFSLVLISRIEEIELGFEMFPVIKWFNNFESECRSCNSCRQPHSDVAPLTDLYNLPMVTVSREDIQW